MLPGVGVGMNRSAEGGNVYLKCFERFSGLDTALYKNILFYTFIQIKMTD